MPMTGPDKGSAGDAVFVEVENYFYFLSIANPSTPWAPWTRARSMLSSYYLSEDKHTPNQRTLLRAIETTRLWKSSSTLKTASVQSLTWPWFWRKLFIWPDARSSQEGSLQTFHKFLWISVFLNWPPWLALEFVSRKARSYRRSSSQPEIYARCFVSIFKTLYLCGRSSRCPVQKLFVTKLPCYCIFQDFHCQPWLIVSWNLDALIISQTLLHESLQDYLWESFQRKMKKEKNEFGVVHLSHSLK